MNKNKNINNKIKLFFGFLFIINNSQAFYTSNFYKSSFLHGQTRIAKDKLSTLDLILSSGNTNCGYDIWKRKTPILGILGPENPLCLDKLKNFFPNLKSDSSIGPLNFTGRFSLVYFQATLYQNLTNGFFIENTVPITSMNIDPLAIENLALLSDFNNKQEYIRLLSNLRGYLKDIGLNPGCIDYTAVADCTSLLGWSTNYEETEFLDFIDLTLKLGVLFPTGHKTNVYRTFDIPNGYNGFWGIPLSADIAWGAMDWLTFGLHVDGICLLASKKEIPLRDCLKQYGFFRDSFTCLNVDPGNVINVSAYIKAEHFIFNLSWILGYTYSRQNKSILKKCKDYNYSENLIINNINIDPIFRSWESHNFNFLVEYDLCEEDQAINTYVGLFYNTLIHGKRVFRTNLFGGNFGINLAFCF